MEMLLFAGQGISEGLAAFLDVARIVLLVIATLACLVLIVTTLLQSSANQAGNAVTGGESDSYFSHSKDNSRDGKLKRITITMASVIAISVVLYFITGLIATL